MTDNSGIRGKQSAVTGFAHEHIAVGILMKKYGDVSLVNLPLSTYDLIIVREKNGFDDFIRAQVKTATKRVSFTGGSRGGIDRTYFSDVKTYRQSPDTSDVIIGVHPNGTSFDLFFIPTILIEILDQDSISINRINPLKNNYDMLENCKDKGYVLTKAIEFNIVREQK
ncbi:MAG TPA: hypothetical protein PLE10_05800 [Brevefilum sp.]|nr:hypothetical protein [Brevefilum sp.]HOR19325.1 hypothetical protein [Brevefilum sp.]HPL69930.1 hypothetical protein [Brevefilum sp.]